MIELSLENRTDLLELAAHQNGPCVSLYQPCGGAAEDRRKSRVRLKNLLRSAAGQLAARGERPQAIDQLLAPVTDLLSSHGFWQRCQDGLALFVSRLHGRCYHGPQRFPEQALVDRRFNLVPLVPMLGEADRYHLLALSKKHTRLIEVRGRQARQVEVAGMPASLEALLQYGERERNLQFHTGTPHGTGKRAAMFHGHADHTDEAAHKEDLLRFFRMIDASLQKILQPAATPLVLAGVDYLLALYREVNDYAGLVDAAVTGNPDRWSPEELRERSWNLVNSATADARRRAAEEYRRNAAREAALVSDNLAAVVGAAHHQRVETLFVREGAHVWGRYNPVANDAQIRAERQPHDEDLVNLAVVRTLDNGGRVYPMLDEELGFDRAPVAATLRYPTA